MIDSDDIVWFWKVLRIPGDMDKEETEEMGKEEIDLICRACWDWMETVMPEYAKEIDLDLNKLDLAVAKLSRNDHLVGIPREERKEDA